ncbi:uncharacterized protein LOC130223621 [Danio aesculapii]|uniref:uncharacterized protein LOC130223621 n=1 Tax=Danio aesculapii TaxID=1142201 RepID=UPI0024C0E647|nr:uncharacterized protein LOC130223621 [Danio aesculapii]
MDYRGDRNEYLSAVRPTVSYRYKPNTPKPSRLSVRSDLSMDYPLKFSGDTDPGFSGYTDPEVRYRPNTPKPSRVSMRSDLSMDYPLKFSGDTDPGFSGYTDPEVRYKPNTPKPSRLSVRSDLLMHYPPKFSGYTDPGFSGYTDPEVRYRPNTPKPSRVSMRSDLSMDYPLKFSGYTDPGFSGYTDPEVRYKPNTPKPSRLSVRSDLLMHYPPKFSGYTDPGFSGYTDPEVRYKPNTLKPSRLSVRSDLLMHYPPKFSGYTDPGFSGYTDPEVRYRPNTPEPSCVSVRSDLSMDYPSKFSGYTDPGFSGYTDPEVSLPKALQTFRSNLLKKFQCVSEGTAGNKSPTLLNEIYTELYITEGDSGEINNEHEVRQIETQSRRSTTEDTPIQCRDIFTALPGQHKAIRTVLTKGVAGIGKTVSVQKFILDWAEEKENQDVQLIFPLPFRELNLMKDRTLSLADLLHVFFPETKEMEISRDEYKVLFIFDGLDECRLSLDFNSEVKLCNISESASVEDLLMNLIVGNLLPSSLIWITSRPAAADLIPSAFVHRLTEVRGFTDPQKEEYFRKRIRDQRLADEMIQHLKSCRSLFIMCHIPVFCWISATVLEEMMRRTGIGEIPKTLTEMYTHFLIIQTRIKHEKHYQKKLKDKEMILKLGKLAFQQLMKGNLIFYEEDLRECGIDESEASVYSGLCTQIFRQELGLFQGKVFCFVHLSIQEHLAALYVHLSFLLDKRDVLNDDRRSKFAHWFTRQTISELHRRAVDKALQSRNGHLDLFLRFLLGLSLKSNQTLLKNLLIHIRNISYSQEKTIDYIKTQIKLNPSPEKSINLFHCLNELGDQSLINEVQQYVRSGDLSGTRLSSSQWSAVVFVLLTSEQLDEFDLSKYLGGNGQNHMTHDKVLQKLLPVVEASRTAVLRNCGVSDEGCAALASALRSNSSNLRELNLTWNKVGDSGVKLLSAGLEDPHCKLEKLVLRNCGVSDEGFAALASVLRSNSSNLRELDLSENKVGDSGVKRLSAGLKDPRCKLEKLELRNCGVSDEGCAALASALRSNSSNLRELDLTCNEVRDSGVKLLSAGLKDPRCKLEKLDLPKALQTFRSNLLKKFQCVSEGTARNKSPTLLNEIYTELYITEGDSGEINNEHEVRQIETQSRRSTTEDTPIQCRDIFTALPGQHKAIRTVLTKGVAGIGKTVSVQKFILDWAEEKENRDIQLIFPLPFREINLMKDRRLSLADLLHVFFPETKEMEISRDGYKVLFIFDGLDECRLSLDFNSEVKLCNISESASVEDLLMNLIVGNLLPSALIWITSRPAAADLVPSECVHRLTEVRGFTDPQKEEYFRKRIRDQRLADEMIQHLKSCRSLFIMCHIPVFCWISATVLEEMMRRTDIGEIPKTLTEMYTHFLIIQTSIKHEKHYKKKLKDEEMILKLGKLAFQQLIKGNLIFYEEDLRECGIDESEASVYSGLCTQIFREELGLFQGKVFCFVHLSIQEHLAALYVLLSFLLDNRDELSENLRSTHPNEFSCHTVSDLHQRAVDKALQSRNGHLDLFLRFLLGLSLKSNQTLLKNHLTQVGNISYSQEEMIEYIKIRIKLNPSPEKSINLFHCLNELGDQSLINEVQQYVRSGDLSGSRLSSSQWSAVVFVLLTSKQLDEFNLSKYLGGNGQNHMTPDKVLQKLLPVVEASRSALLWNCGVSDEGCAALASALRSNSSNLRELDLSENKVGDSGVKLLSAGLEDPHCKLEKLVLKCCGVSDEGCAALASALRSNSSNLRELDLSGNKVGDSGVKLLSAGLEDLHCKLEKLMLRNCGVSDEGCAALASALRSNSSNLRELDLSVNKVGDSEVKLLSDGLKDPHCKLEKLMLRNCGVSDEGCAALASVLRSNSSNLRELNLSVNNLGDSGVKLLSAGLEDLHCKLEKLMLRNCGVSDEGCAALASALRSNSSNLRELNLSVNEVGDSGVKRLSAGLKDPHCKLEKLELSGCGVSDEGCAALASALRSNSSNLRELNLSGNKVGDSGVKRLSDLRDDPHYKLETLRFNRY